MRASLMFAALLVGTCLSSLVAADAKPPEARVTIDVKDGDIHALIAALSEVAGFQAVFDPGLGCRLTLNVKSIEWRHAFRAAITACGYGYDEDGKVLRIAARERLIAEATEERQLKEKRREARTRRVERFRLSYARAQELAPIVKRFLSERGEVVWDERTNTLIVID